MRKIITIERKLLDTGEWEPIEAFSLEDDGSIEGIQGDPVFIKDMKFIDREVEGSVTHESHPNVWLRHLAVEYSGPDRRLTIEGEDGEVVS